MTVADAPWPGFTPDLLSIVLVVATQAKGTVLIHQKSLRADCSLLINSSIWVRRLFCAIRTELLVIGLDP